MNRSRRQPRGTTLVEVMIASTIALAILAGTMSVGLEFQRQAQIQNQVMDTQNAGRIVRNFLIPAIESAGTGVGTATLTLGTDSRGAVAGRTADDFSSDSTFSAPPAPYDVLISDSILLTSGDTGTLLATDFCTSGNTTRQGVNICMANPVDAALANGSPTFLFANSKLGVACVHEITGVTGSDKIQINPGHGANPVPSNEPCSTTNGTFWDSPAIAMQASASAYRINWPNGEPVLEYDEDGDLGSVVNGVATNQPFRPIARDIERMQVRFGVIDLTDPTAPPQFYPDAGAGRPAIDQCDNSCPLPGVLDALDADPSTDPDAIVKALRRRVRVLELVLTMRTERRDASLIRRSGSSFELDEEGFFRDGFRRRVFITRIAPRNMRFAGISQ